jgi:hypothetical protein
MGTGADSFGREPHTAHEWVESLGADVRARIEFGREREVRARTGRRRWWVQTGGRMLEALHWQNNCNIL